MVNQRFSKYLKTLKMHMFLVNIRFTLLITVTNVKPLLSNNYYNIIECLILLSGNIMAINNSDIDALGFMSENHNVDLEISLDGMDEATAIETANRAIDEGIKNNISKIWFQFSMGNNDGKKTLFHPVGNALKARLSNKEILRLMPSSVGGWIARFK